MKGLMGAFLALAIKMSARYRMFFALIFCYSLNAKAEGPH